MTAPAPLAAIHRRTTSTLHHESIAAIVGIGLGVTFGICFATGVLSHLIQQPPDWFVWPARPAGAYRVSQGLHVICGFATIPLLFAKLWVVYPRLFEWPPITSVLHGLERLALLPLVGGGLFMAFSGTGNVARWYPWSFFFPTAHYWMAWVTMGAMVVHLGAKWAIVRTTVRRGSTDSAPGTPDHAERRRFLGGVGATTAVVVAAVAGNTVGPLSAIAALAQRRPGTGPQGIPVNKSARGARVVDAATDPGYRLGVEFAGRTTWFTLDELEAMPQHSATLPIACVEGWSSSGTWTGVRLRDLVAAAGAERVTTVGVESLQRGGLYRRSEVNANQAADRDTLLALQLNGEVLHIDHGYPVRLIGPNRPGVQQTKWVNRLVVS